MKQHDDDRTQPTATPAPDYLARTSPTAAVAVSEQRVRGEGRRRKP